VNWLKALEKGDGSAKQIKKSHGSSKCLFSLSESVLFRWQFFKVVFRKSIVERVMRRPSKDCLAGRWCIKSYQS